MTYLYLLRIIILYLINSTKPFRSTHLIHFFLMDSKRIVSLPQRGLTVRRATSWSFSSDDSNSSSIYSQEPNDSSSSSEKSNSSHDRRLDVESSHHSESHITNSLLQTSSSNLFKKESNIFSSKVVRLSDPNITSKTVSSIYIPPPPKDFFSNPSLGQSDEPQHLNTVPLATSSIVPFVTTENCFAYLPTTFRSINTVNQSRISIVRYVNESYTNKNENIADWKFVLKLLVPLIHLPNILPISSREDELLEQLQLIYGPPDNYLIAMLSLQRVKQTRANNIRAHYQSRFGLDSSSSNVALSNLENYERPAKRFNCSDHLSNSSTHPTTLFSFPTYHDGNGASFFTGKSFINRTLAALPSLKHYPQKTLFKFPSFGRNSAQLGFRDASFESSNESNHSSDTDFYTIEEPIGYDPLSLSAPLHHDRQLTHIPSNNSSSNPKTSMPIYSLKKKVPHHSMSQSSLQHDISLTLKKYPSTLRIGTKVNSFTRRKDSERQQRFFLRLQQRVKPLHSSIIKIRHDGNCLFRTASFQLFGTEDLHAWVRHNVVCHMSTEKSRYSPYFEKNMYAKYLLEMSRDFTWGDELTVRGIADAFHCTIHLLTYRKHHWYLRYDPQNHQNQPVPIKRHLFFLFAGALYYLGFYPTIIP